eukprot:38183-Chlamydomonas_euryale.AAC.3
MEQRRGVWGGGRATLVPQGGGGRVTRVPRVGGWKSDACTSSAWVEEGETVGQGSSGVKEEHRAPRERTARQRWGRGA